MRCKAFFKAFTLVEAVLVLALSVTILLAGAKQYQKYIQQKNIAILKNSVESLLIGLQRYANLSTPNSDNANNYCVYVLREFLTNNHSLPTKPLALSVDDLNNAGVLEDSSLIYNPFDTQESANASFVMSINATELPFMVTVSVTFPTTLSIQEFQNIAENLQATSISTSNYTMSWNLPLVSASIAADDDNTALLHKVNQFNEAQLEAFVVNGYLQQSDLQNSNFTIPCQTVELYLQKNI